MLQLYGEELQGIAPAFPLLFLFFGSVVGAVDVPYVMAGEAVRMADKKGGAFSFPRPLHQAPRGSINQLYILAVDRFRRNAEGFRPRLDLARSCFAIVGVFVVKIIF